MKALEKYGTPSEFGSYKWIDVAEPVCGDGDIIIEIKAAAICGADMKHYKFENDSDKFGSVRGDESSLMESKEAIKVILTYDCD